jgi:hypothetical protein
MEKPNEGVGSPGTERFPDFCGFNGGSLLVHRRPPNVDLRISAWPRHVCVVRARKQYRTIVGFEKCLEERFPDPRIHYGIGRSMVTIPALAKLYQGEDVLFPEGATIYNDP